MNSLGRDSEVMRVENSSPQSETSFNQNSEFTKDRSTEFKRLHGGQSILSSASDTMIQRVNGGGSQYSQFSETSLKRMDND